MNFSTDNSFAAELDAADPLALFRDKFASADPDLIYLDGNSLGRLPKRTMYRLHDVLAKEWGAGLVRSWGSGWFAAPTRIGAKIARLIGAREDEVLVADSTSVNLFKLVVAALRFKSARTTVITDEFNFPSDVYVMTGAAGLLGKHVALARSPDGIHMPNESITREMTSDTALVALSHVAFKTGYMYDMRAITQAAHNAGALMLWDLCHSVGAVPVDLSWCGVDLAVGCTYKYLNGGPGSPAFLYVRRDLQEQLLTPIWGWIGRRKPFDFDLDYQPQPDIRRFMAGTPPILSMAAVEDGVDILLEAGMERLRERSVRQTEYLIDLAEQLLMPLGFTLGSPKDSSLRGSHVSLRHPNGLQIDQAMIHDVNVIPDFRAPDNIRLGVTPLYTTFVEIREAVERIARVVTERLYEKYSADAPEVT